MPDDALHAALRTELRQLAVASVSRATPEGFPELFSLRTVRSRAPNRSEPTQQAALRATLQLVVQDLWSVFNRQLAPYAFGLNEFGFRTLNLRLRDAEPELKLKANTLRKNSLPPLVEEVGHRLVEIEEDRAEWDAYRPGERPWPEEQAHLERRYDFYFLMSAYLHAFARDLETMLEARHEGNEQQARAFAESALWRWAKFDRLTESFLEQCFVWTLEIDSNEPHPRTGRTADDLSEVTDIVTRLDGTNPLDPRPRSEIRCRVGSALRQDLAPFLESLSDADGRAILRSWLTWGRACKCDLDRPRRDCAVHSAINDGLRFRELINYYAPLGRPEYAERLRLLPDPLI